MTKYVISETLGSAFSKDGEEVVQYPMSIDGSFNTEEAAVVETWDEAATEEKDRILKSLA